MVRNAAEEIPLLSMNVSDFLRIIAVNLVFLPVTIFLARTQEDFPFISLDCVTLKIKSL